MSDAAWVGILGEARLFAYTLFQKLIGNEPTQELLDVALADRGHREALSLFAFDADGDYAQALEAFSACADVYSAGREGFLEDARAEYMHLFVGPASLVAPPWESIYVSSEELLFQESTLEVRRFYRSQGLERATAQNEPDDHLATELDFMAHLAQRCIEGMKEDGLASSSDALSASARFLDEHMLTWVDDFAVRAQNAKTSWLYPQVARLIAAFIHADRAVLDELVTM